jgi:photosystem II stability/assembly factor-like uncharacterized protein
LYGVFFTDVNNGIIVGDVGTILKTTNAGTNWTYQTSGTTKTLYGVKFLDANNGIVVGDSGTILKTTDAGTTWASLTSGTPNNLWGITFINVNTWTVVGDAGTILKTTDAGTTWTPQTSGTSSDLKSVFFVNADTGMVVGHLGTILKTTDAGTTWIPQTSGTGQDLKSVFLFNADNAIVVGFYGTILRTTNGGTDWTIENSGTSNNLWSVTFTDANNGTIVGQGGTILRTTGPPDFVIANLKVYLEGPYNGSGGMTTTLNSNNLIPLDSDDPYPTTVYGYTASTVSSIPDSVVDWVLVELRTGTASTTKVDERAGFLKSNGTILDTDGTSPLEFTGLSAGNYYVVVRHRNHLAIMTASAISLSSSSAQYNFCTAQSQAFGINPMKDLGSGNFAMIAGDMDGDGNIDYSNDLLNKWLPSFGFYGYLSEDTNLNSDVDYTEDLLNDWLPNFGFATQVP